MSPETAKQIDSIRQMRERWAKAAELQEQLGAIMAEIYTLSGADTGDSSADIYKEHAASSREIVATYDETITDIERKHAAMN